MNDFSLYNRLPIGIIGSLLRTILLGSTQVERLQKRKKICFALTKWISGLLVLCLGVRFIPAVNDWISGPAEPMRVIAEQLAKSLASATDRESPVIVAHAETENCQTAQHNSSTDYYVILYVITYSEQSRSVCLTTYLHFVKNPQANTVLISESMGRNYGYPMPAPVKAMPAENRLTTFPQQYLSLLHWRTTPRFPLSHAESLIAHTRHYSPNEYGPSGGMDVQLDLQQMRATVAAKHNLVNHALFNALIALSFSLLIVCGWILAILMSFQRNCRRYGFAVGLRMFFRENLISISERAYQTYLAQEQDARERFRAANALDQAIHEIRTKLQSLLEDISDEKARAEIIDSLQRNQLEQMKAVYEQYQTKAHQKTPEDKLALLLESLKPYCSAEEFECHRTEAFVLLHRSGFRTARDFAVDVHDEMRERYKKSAEELATEEDEERSTGTDDQ